MKNLLKKYVLFLLKKFAKRRLKKFKGTIIGVTGSVGKTSTKEAVYTILNTKYKVLRNKGSMNTDFGLPLTVLELDTGWKSIVKWSYLIFRAFFKSFQRLYAEVVVVEMGVDKAGDMDALLSIVTPDIGIVGPVAPVHMEKHQFTNVDEVFEEKSKLIKALPEDGIAILCADDERVLGLSPGRPKGRTFTFGTNPDADFKATAIEEDTSGIKFNLNTEGHRVEVRVPVLGKHHVNVILPAIICGMAMKMELGEIVEAIKRFKLPPGRLNLIEGFKDDLTIIDSSYNSSPKACIEALKTLGGLNPKGKGRRIAILGNMNELGENSELLHAEVGSQIHQYCEVLVTVGDLAKIFADKAEENGMKNVFRFKTVSEAIEKFKDELKEGDIVLVKGSQNNVRLEKFVKAIMKFPDTASEVLCRQGRVWERI